MTPNSTPPKSVNVDIEIYEINKITEFSKPRERAFFTLMKQSGLTPKTIKQLRVRNLEDFELNTTAPLKITLPENSRKDKFGKNPIFIGEEAIRYLNEYLKPNRKPENLLFTAHNNSNGEIDLQNVIRSFRSTVKKLKEQTKIPHTKKGKPNNLKLSSLTKFYKKNAKAYLTELKNSHTPKNDEFYRKLYEEKAMPYLETNPLTSDIHQIKKQTQNRINILNNENKQFKERLDLLENAVKNFLKKPEKPREKLILDAKIEKEKIEEEIREYKIHQKRIKEAEPKILQQMKHEAEERQISIEELQDDADFASYTENKRIKKEQNTKIKKLKDALTD